MDQSPEELKQVTALIRSQGGKHLLADAGLQVVDVGNVRLALIGQIEQDGAAVCGIGTARDQPLTLKAVHQRSNVAGGDAKPLREVAHADATGLGHLRQQVRPRHREAVFERGALYADLAVLLEGMHGGKEGLGKVRAGGRRPIRITRVMRSAMSVQRCRGWGDP